MRSRRRERPSIGLLAVWSSILAIGITMAGSVALAQSSPAPVGSNEGRAGPTLTLVTQSAWVAPNGELVLRIKPSAVASTAVIRTQIYPEVDGRIRFERSLRGEGLSSPLRPGPAPFALADASILTDGSVQIVVPVSRSAPAPEGGVVLTGSGVHPVVVSAIGPDGSELTRLTTHLIRLPTTDTTGPSLAVGTIVAFDGQVRPTPDGTPTLSAGDTERATTQIDALSTWPAVGLTIDPKPAVIAALDADPASRPDVASLRSHLAGRQVLGTSYAKVDSGAWVNAGLEPELDDQLAAGSLVISAALGTTADGRFGVADPTLTPEALARLRALGLDRLVIPTDQLGPLSDEQTVTFTEQFDITDSSGQAIRGITADQALDARLRATEDPVLNGHRVLADLAVLYNDEPGISRGVALDVGSDLPPATLEVLMAAFAERTPPGSDARAIVSPVTLDDLFRTTETATTLTRGRTTTLTRAYLSAPPAPLGAYPARRRSIARDVEGFRSLTEPVPGSADGLDRMLLLAGAADLSAEERNGILAQVDTRIESVTNEIVAPLQQFVTLTSRSGKIPLNLENRSAMPVRVHVVLASPKLEFPDGDVIDTVLPAATTTRLDVQVTTRASGAFPLEVSVRSPDDVLEVATTRFTVRSTAISGAGLVLSIGAGLFLLVWWARHFRKARRAKKLVDSSHPALSGHAPATATEDAEGYAPAHTD